MAGLVLVEIAFSLPTGGIGFQWIFRFERAVNSWFAWVLVVGSVILRLTWFNCSRMADNFGGLFVWLRENG